MLTTGSMFAGYRIVRVLGSGGMGSVYLAHSPDLPRLDALKVLSSAYGREPESRARFLREAAVAAALTHPNIVAIYRRGETAEGQLWIAMQYVDGTDADAALRAGTMTPQRAVRIVGEVAKALDYAHRHNVVHRDVKPANFLLAGQHDAAERVLLGDFGIARGLEDIGLTTTGSVLATMAYAAPEVLAGHSFDGRADVYSLGCSLFRLLAGTTPFTGGNGPAAMMLAHLHKPPPRLTDRMPDLPPALDAVLARSLAKDPVQRFRTAGEFADAAKTALRDAAFSVSRAVLPSSAVDVSPTIGPGRWYPASGAPPAAAEPRPHRRKHFVRWAATTLAAIAVVATAAVLMLSHRADRASTLPAAPTTSRPTAPPTPTTVPVAELPKLLLDNYSLGIRLNVNNFQMTSTSTALLDSSGDLTEPGCVSAWAPAQVAVYADSGDLATQVQAFTSEGAEAQRTTLTQAVIAFPNRDSAQNVVAAQFSQWQHCANRATTVTIPGSGPMQVNFGTPIGSPGTIRLMSQQLEPLPQQHCQRALGSRSNVVVDIAACSPSIAEPARALASGILGEIPPD